MAGLPRWSTVVLLYFWFIAEKAEAYCLVFCNAMVPQFSIDARKNKRETNIDSNQLFVFFGNQLVSMSVWRMVTRSVCWRFIRNALLKVNHTETMCSAVKPWPWNPEVGQTDASLENQLFGSRNNAECSSLSWKRDRKLEKQRLVYKCGNWFPADLWHVRVCFRLCGPLAVREKTPKRLQK